MNINSDIPITPQTNYIINSLPVGNTEKNALENYVRKATEGLKQGEYSYKITEGFRKIFTQKNDKTAIKNILKRQIANIHKDLGGGIEIGNKVYRPGQHGYERQLDKAVDSILKACVEANTRETKNPEIDEIFTKLGKIGGTSGQRFSMISSTKSQLMAIGENLDAESLKTIDKVASVLKRIERLTSG